MRRAFCRFRKRECEDCVEGESHRKGKFWVVAQDVGLNSTATCYKHWDDLTESPVGLPLYPWKSPLLPHQSTKDGLLYSLMVSYNV